MGQKTMQQIEKIKKMGRAMSIFFNVLQWFLIIPIIIMAALIIWSPSEPLTKEGEWKFEFGGLSVAASMPDESMSSARFMAPAPSIELKLLSVSLTGNRLNPNIRAFLIIMIVIFFFLVFKGLHHLKRLFGNIAVGDIFSGKNIGQIRKLGFISLFLGVFNLAPLILILQNLRNYIFRENFQVTGILFPLDGIIFGCLCLLSAWIMDVGRDMQEENELTV